MEVRSVSGPGIAPNVAAMGSASTARASGPREYPEVIDKSAPELIGIRTRQAAPKKEAMQQTGTRLRVDKASKRIVAQIVNQQNEVVRQIPPEDMLKIAAHFAELQGRLFDEKA